MIKQIDKGAYVPGQISYERLDSIRNGLTPTKSEAMALANEILSRREEISANNWRLVETRIPMQAPLSLHNDDPRSPVEIIDFEIIELSGVISGPDEMGCYRVSLKEDGLNWCPIIMISDTVLSAAKWLQGSLDQRALRLAAYLNKYPAAWRRKRLNEQAEAMLPMFEKAARENK